MMHVCDAAYEEQYSRLADTQVSEITTVQYKREAMEWLHDLFSYWGRGPGGLFH